MIGLPSVDAEAVGGDAVSAVSGVGSGDSVRCGDAIGGSDQGSGEVGSPHGGGGTADSGGVGLGGGDSVLGSRDAVPVGGFVNLAGGFGGLADGFSVMLDDSFSGSSVSLVDGAGGVLGCDGGVNGGGLCVTRVHAVRKMGEDGSSRSIADDGNKSDLLKNSLYN